MMLRASSSSLTPLTLEAVAALLFAAVVVLLLAGMFYVILAGSVAWVLMLLQGLLWLVFHGLRRVWTTLRGHSRAAAGIAAEATPDIAFRAAH